MGGLCAHVYVRDGEFDKEKAPPKRGFVEWEVYPEQSIHRSLFYRTETVSPWSRRAVGICRLDTCRSEPCQPEAPEEAAPCAAGEGQCLAVPSGYRHPPRAARAMS